MPQIQFRTGLDDKIGHACAWLRKAAERGARTRVIGPPADLKAIDEALWKADGPSFVPHAWAGAAGASQLQRTALWLGVGDVPQPPPTLLLNLGADIPDTLHGYERVVELVSTAPDDVQAGRSRWIDYKRRGLEPHHLHGDPASPGESPAP